MKILVYGWYGKQNIGDESYKATFPRLFSGHELTFTHHLSNQLVDSHEAIILGGGNILNDHHLTELSKYRGRQVVAFSVGHTDKIDYELCKKLVSQAYVRDYKALNRLREAGIFCEYCPDAAYALEPDRSAGRKSLELLLQDRGLSLSRKTIGVIVNGHLPGFGQDALSRDALRFQMFAMDLAAILDRMDVNLLFLPMMTQPPWDDRTSNSWVASRCKWYQKVGVVYETWDAQEMLNVISSLDAVVSTRLHSTIFACLSGVPFVDIWHHDKNLSFLETVDRLGWAVSYWDFSKERTQELLGNMLKDSHYGEGLQKVAKSQKDLLVRIVNGIRFGK